MLERVRGSLKPGADGGEQVQLAKILGVLDGTGRECPLRIVGLVFQGGDPVDRGQEILGFAPSG